MAAQASTPHRMRASCYCGAVHVVVADADAATSSSICHCSVCRRLSGAPFLANVLFKRGNVALETADGAAVDADALAAQATSKHVTRYRCKACASPVLAHLGKDAAAAPSLASSAAHMARMQHAATSPGRRTTRVMPPSSGCNTGSSCPS